MMTVLGTGISWTNSTWNPWFGRKPVSAGCDNCYAAGIVNNPYFKFGHRFDEVRIHLNRLAQISKFRPIATGVGVEPHKVFVNSMSDFFIEDVPDAVIHQVLDAMEGTPDVVFQILSKRPIRDARSSPTASAAAAACLNTSGSGLASRRTAWRPASASCVASRIGSAAWWRSSLWSRSLAPPICWSSPISTGQLRAGRAAPMRGSCRASG